MTKIPEWWIETTLKQCVNTNEKSITKNYLYEKILYLDTWSITENKIEWLQEFLVNKAPSRAKRLVKDWDIIYSTVRPNQKHFWFIKNPQKNLVVSTWFAVLSPKENSDWTFIYYYITQDYITEKLHIIAEQAVSTYPSIKPENIENLSIFLPPLPEQKAIAGVLSSFDDKIELLRAENQTLEEMGQTLFKERFGKYKVWDELPNGWKVGKLTDIADFLNWIALQKFPPKWDEKWLPIVKIREMKAGITGETDRATKDIDEKYIIQNEDVLFSRSWSLELVFWEYWPWALNQHLFKVSSDKYPKWFYYYWIKHHLTEFRSIASNKATTMWHIQRCHLERAEVIIPSDNDLHKFDEVMDKLLKKIFNNKSTIHSLTESRDQLLPKLMSWEVRVEF